MLGEVHGTWCVIVSHSKPPVAWIEVQVECKVLRNQVAVSFKHSVKNNYPKGCGVTYDGLKEYA